MYSLDGSIKYNQGSGFPQSEETFLRVILTEIWTDFLLKPDKWIFKFHCNEMEACCSLPHIKTYEARLGQNSVTEAFLPRARL